MLCARREDRLRTLADQLQAEHGVAVHTVVLDVRDADQVEQTLGTLPEAWQTIDVLVNNAGLSRGLDTVYQNKRADIEAMSQMSPGEAEAFSRLGHRAFATLEQLAVPTIAAVNGFALGGGCELAMSCDWIYASTKARFGQPEVKLGLIPGFGGTSRLVRRVGIGWAKELVCSGVNLTADEAQRIGLVNRLFEPDELLAKTLEAGSTSSTVRSLILISLSSTRVRSWLPALRLVISSPKRRREVVRGTKMHSSTGTPAGPASQ